MSMSKSVQRRLAVQNGEKCPECGDLGPHEAIAARMQYDRVSCPNKKHRAAEALKEKDHG
jgi:hypothetical protein